MKRRIIFLGILVLVLMAWVFGASADGVGLSADGFVSFNFQVGLPTEKPENGGFYSLGPVFWLNGYDWANQSPVEWDVQPTNGGPAFSIELTNPVQAMLKQVEDATYTADTTYNYRISCTWNGNTYTYDAEIHFISTALPGDGFGLSVAELDMTTTPTSFKGDWAEVKDKKMEMTTGKKYAVRQDLGTNSIFKEYVMHETVFYRTAWEEFVLNGRQQNPDGSYTDYAKYCYYTAKEPGTYDHSYTVRYRGSNLACYIPYTLYLADENGVVPPPQLEYGYDELTWYTDLPMESSAQGGVYSMGELEQIWIPYEVRDYNDFNTEWSMERISGLDQFELNHQENPTSQDSYFTATLQPKDGVTMTAGDSRYKVTAKYKGITYEATLTIHTKPGSSLNTVMNIRAFGSDENGNTIGQEISIINGELTVCEGESFFISGVMSGDHPTLNAEQQWMNFPFYFPDNELDFTGDWHGDQNDFTRTNNIYTCNTRRLVANTAGTYSIEPWLAPGDSNFAIVCPITIHVQDPQGLADVGLELMGDYPWTDGTKDTIEFPVYLGLDFQGTPWQWNDIIKVYVSNYDDMFARYHGVPIWTVERTDRNGTDLYYSWGPDNWGGLHGRAYGRLNVMPTQTMEAVIKITCQWGGQTVSKRILIHVVNPGFSMPTGLDELPDVIETQLGATEMLAPTVLPSGWTGVGYTPIVFMANRMEPFAEWQYGTTKSTATYIPQEAGIYRERIGLMLGTIMVTKEVTFRIKDQSGIVPKDAPKISTEYNGERTYFIGAMAEERPVTSYETPQSRLRITAMSIIDYNKIKSDFSGQPSITAVSSDPTVGCHVEMYGTKDGAGLYLNSIPTTEKDVTFTMSLDWDGTHTDYSLVVHFTEAPSLPDGMTMVIRNPLVVKAGEVLPLSRIFRSMWSVQGYNVNILSLLASDGSRAGIQKQMGNQGFIYKAADPGVYTAEIALQWNNIIWHQRFKLIITAADGTLDQSLYTPLGAVAQMPAGVTRIESQAFAGTMFTEADIPAGVTIAGDAFEGTGLIAVYTHDQRTVEWAVANGYVALVEGEE